MDHNSTRLVLIQIIEKLFFYLVEKREKKQKKAPPVPENPFKEYQKSKNKKHAKQKHHHQ